MKKSVLLLVISFLIFSATAQTSKIPSSIEEINAQIRESQISFEKGFVELDNYPVQKFDFLNKKAFDSNSLKNASTNTQKLDSMLSEHWDSDKSQWETPYSKAEYSYDKSGNRISRVFYSRDEADGQWVFSRKNEYTYDNNKVILDIRSLWNKDLEIWENDEREEYSYDENGYKQQYLWFIWDTGSSEWVGFWKIDESYDADGRRTMYTYTQWNTSINDWLASWKQNWEFADNGIQVLYIRSNYYTSTGWVADVKTETELDSDGKPIYAIDYEWGNDTEQWLVQGKSWYTVDDNSYITQSIYYQWNIDDSIWVMTSQEEFVYDLYGRMLQYISFNWISNANSWEGEEKIEYDYDANGNETLMRGSVWDADSDQWTIKMYFEYGYDNSGNQVLWRYQNVLSDMGLLVESEFNSDGGILQETKYNWGASISDYYLTYRYTYYYSDQVISSVSEPILTDQVKTYPNPARDYVVFDIDSHSAFVELFDMQGKKVLSQELLETKQIDLSDLKSGIYFYKLVQADRTLSGKIIVK